MKVRNALFFFGIIIALSGCSDDGPTTQNAVTLNGTKFNITTASIVGVAIDGDGHAGITFVYAGNGGSKTLNIDVEYAGDSNVAGTYSFPQDAGDRLLLDGLTYYNEVNSQGGFFAAMLVEGHVTIVNHGGNKYTVEMDLEMEEGKVFSGQYTGTFVTQFNNQ